MKKLAVLLLLAMTYAMCYAETIIYLPPGGGIQPCIITGGVITCI